MARFFCHNTSIGSAVSDDAVDWTALSVPYTPSNVYSAHSVASGHIVIGDSAGSMYISEDEGDNWTLAFSIGSPFPRIVAALVSNSRFIGFNVEGTMVLRPFGGSTTTDTSSPLALNTANSVLADLGTNVLAFCVASGEPYTRLSSDGGASWGAWTLKSGEFGSGSAICNAASFGGYMVAVGQDSGGDGGIWYSSGLSTWTRPVTVAGGPFGGILALPDRILAWNDFGELYESFNATGWSFIAGTDPFYANLNFADSTSRGSYDATLGIILPQGSIYQSLDNARTLTDITDAVTASGSIFLVGAAAAPYTRFWTDYVQAVETPG